MADESMGWAANEGAAQLMGDDRQQLLKKNWIWDSDKGGPFTNATIDVKLWSCRI